jgi:hypothetical protein
MKPMLTPRGTKRSKLKCDILLSTFAFKFNLRRYIKGMLEGMERLYGMDGTAAARRPPHAARHVIPRPRHPTQEPRVGHVVDDAM